MTTKHHITLSLMCLMALAAGAQEWVSGGLRYRVIADDEAAVAPWVEAGHSRYADVVIVPETVYYDGLNYRITTIADSAFYNSSITELQLPNSITHIGRWAMADAFDLHSVTLPLYLDQVSEGMMAGTNITSIRKSVNDDHRTVITTSSSCTFNLRDEYPAMLDIDNGDIRDNISLATRFIYNLVDDEKVKLIFKQDFKRRMAYHTACHMQRMGWQLYSIELLRMIPGLDLQVLEQECCGISGTYGFKKENYERSQAIGSVLFKHIADAQVEAVTTDCETCKWQIEMSTGLPVENPISVLADALDVEATRRANGI